MTDPQTPPLMRALKVILRPLVKLLVARGVPVRSATQAMREVYVEVIASDFVLRGEKVTDSRISLLSGLPRKEVRRLREMTPEGRPAAARQLSATATVLGRWLADPAYSDDGAPRALPRQGDLSFESLVQSAMLDMRARTVLDEMERQSLVTIDSEDVIRLRPGAFASGGDAEQTDEVLAANIGAHVEAAARNVLGKEPRTLERAVHYNRLSPASVSEIEAKAREMAHALLVEVNQMAYDRQQSDKAEAANRSRFRFGMYFLGETPETAPEDRDTSE
ncbi:MAG: DUF6502 family protein [Pseudomonadota bacterium]